MILAISWALHRAQQLLLRVYRQRDHSMSQMTLTGVGLGKRQSNCHHADPRNLGYYSTPHRIVSNLLNHAEVLLPNLQHPPDSCREMEVKYLPDLLFLLVSRAQSGNYRLINYRRIRGLGHYRRIWRVFSRKVRDNSNSNQVQAVDQLGAHRESLEIWADQGQVQLHPPPMVLGPVNHLLSNQIQLYPVDRHGNNKRTHILFNLDKHPGVNLPNCNPCSHHVPIKQTLPQHLILLLHLQANRRLHRQR